MTTDNYPRRVVAIKSADDNEVKLYGYGLYVGDENCPKLYDIPNPKIELDDGKVVWGFECWWTDESRAKGFIGKRKITFVEADDDD